MSKSEEKSLGQVLYEAEHDMPWHMATCYMQQACEAQAQAVAAVVREQCAQVCESRAGMRGTGAWTALVAAADAIRSMKP